MRKEQKYGIYAIVCGLFLSVLAWIPIMTIAATLSSELDVGGS